MRVETMEQHRPPGAGALEGHGHCLQTPPEARRERNSLSRPLPDFLLGHPIGQLGRAHGGLSVPSMGPAWMRKGQSREENGCGVHGKWGEQHSWGTMTSLPGPGMEVPLGCVSDAAGCPPVSPA